MLITARVLIAADIDTRAITRRLREVGSLIGVLTTDKSKTDDDLIEMSKIWSIVGEWSFFVKYTLFHFSNVPTSQGERGNIFLCDPS